MVPPPPRHEHHQVSSPPKKGGGSDGREDLGQQQQQMDGHVDVVDGDDAHHHTRTTTTKQQTTESSSAGERPQQLVAAAWWIRRRAQKMMPTRGRGVGLVIAGLLVLALLVGGGGTSRWINLDYASVCTLYSSGQDLSIFIIHVHIYVRCICTHARSKHACNDLASIYVSAILHASSIYNLCPPATQASRCMMIYDTWYVWWRIKQLS